MSSEPCTLTLVVNGEAVEPDDAAEVLELVYRYGCPDGPLVADVAVDRRRERRARGRVDRSPAPADAAKAALGPP